MIGVDVNTVARVLNVTPRAVQQWGDKLGFPPKLAHGLYDLQKTTLWYIRDMQLELSRRGGEHEPRALRAARLRLLKEQANRIETENMVQRGELVEYEAVRDGFVKKLVNCRQRLRGIPSAVGPTLTNKSDPAYIVDRVRVAIEAALSELDGDAGDSVYPNGQTERSQ
jgi:phage terminase Nu1 subunit (DNA packaging protein)